MRTTSRLFLLLVLGSACSSGRVAVGEGASSESSNRRNEAAFGPEPVARDGLGNQVMPGDLPVGVSVAIGEGETTPPDQQPEPVPVATPTGTPRPAPPASTSGGTNP